MSLSLSACAVSPTAEADKAQLADVASTSLGVANGLQEANPVVAPLVNAGPVGLISLAGIKVGINRLAPRQSPRSCRTLLSVSTAAGWGATVNNLALLIAPPLALAAIPVSLHSYYNNWSGSALRTCYDGQLTYAILSVPESIAPRDLPSRESTALYRVIGNWPRLTRIGGTHALNGHILVQADLVGDLADLETLVEEHGLPWTVVAAWNDASAGMLRLTPAMLVAHMSSTIRPEEASDGTTNLHFDAVTGTVSLRTREGRRWPIASLSRAYAQR